MVTPDVGGHVALDLANTIEPSREHLATAQDLASWAARHDLSGSATLGRARALRRAIYEVFRPIADGGEPSAEALSALQAFHAQAVATAQLTPSGFAWADDALAPVAVAAVDLLRGGPLDRVSVCAACPWLFLDTSRNHSRRWCSMDDCGARAKMRRYRSRATR
ncbi:MAG TPA: ABATE domain-containing protein [Solirubrobacteraceae bacterium]|jgi:predicted RNA-binding Zn ribbon-like protein